MDGILLHRDGTATAATVDSVTAAFDAQQPFWLDLHALGADGAELLRGGFGFHELAVEDAEHFGQRPKIEDYDDFTYLVVYGALPDGTTDEVHGFVTGRFLVTVRRGPSALFDELRARLARRGANDRVDVARPVTVLYAVMDRLVDSFFPVLTTIDDRIDDLEDDILARPTQAQLGELFTLKRTLVQMRKVVGPERDLVASVLAGVGGLPGLGSGQERYFRDLYDHLIRISDLVDSYRDLLSGALDTHLSTVSNRLNLVMKQLTIIATIFLPMSFLTGFFGQNFGWMVGRLSSGPVFAAVGIGAQVVTVAVLFAFFWRRGWIGSP